MYPNVDLSIQRSHQCKPVLCMAIAALDAGGPLLVSGAAGGHVGRGGGPEGGSNGMDGGGGGTGCMGARPPRRCARREAVREAVVQEVRPPGRPGRRPRAAEGPEERQEEAAEAAQAGRQAGARARVDDAGGDGRDPTERGRIQRPRVNQGFPPPRPPCARGDASRRRGTGPCTWTASDRRHRDPRNQPRRDGGVPRRSARKDAARRRPRRGVGAAVDAVTAGSTPRTLDPLEGSSSAESESSPLPCPRRRAGLPMDAPRSLVVASSSAGAGRESVY